MIVLFGKGKKKEVITEKNHNAWIKGKSSYTTPTYLLPKQTVTEQSKQHTHLNKWKIKFKLINYILLQ